jgi:hypothetical protein
VHVTLFNDIIPIPKFNTWECTLMDDALSHQSLQKHCRQVLTEESLLMVFQEVPLLSQASCCTCWFNNFCWKFVAIAGAICNNNIRVKRTWHDLTTDLVKGDYTSSPSAWAHTSVAVARLEWLWNSTRLQSSQGVCWLGIWKFSCQQAWKFNKGSSWSSRVIDGGHEFSAPSSSSPPYLGDILWLIEVIIQRHRELYVNWAPIGHPGQISISSY